MGAQPITPRVALITGASRPPGPDLAQALAAQDWRVALNDLNPYTLDEIVQQITIAGGQARAHIADISQKLALQTILNDIEDEWGHIDALINNTRVMPNQPLLDMDEWDWRHTLDVNLTGAFLLTQVVGRMMRARGGGAIIHLLQPDETPGHAAYAATQAGIEKLIQVARQELEAFRIQVHFFRLDKITDNHLMGKILDVVKTAM
jgi:3-oxoacyl-[acyl-carrier protein] reductase